MKFYVKLRDLRVFMANCFEYNRTRMTLIVMINADFSRLTCLSSFAAFVAHFIDCELPNYLTAGKMQAPIRRVSAERAVLSAFRHKIISAE